MEKLFFLSGHFPPRTGGEVYNCKISSLLAKQGFELQYVALLARKPLFRLGKIPIVGPLVVSLILAVLLCKYNGVLIEDHYFSKYLLFTNLIQRFLRKKKIITLVHLFYGYDSKDPIPLRGYINKLQEQFWLSFADDLVTSSEYSKREIVSTGIAAAKVHVVSPGLDRDKFIRLPRLEDDQDSKKILCVANFEARKGIIYLIEAFAKIDRKGFSLHLVGHRNKSSIYYNKLLAITQKFAIEDCVHFYDGADQELIKYLYSTSEIFVLPSFKETFGIVFLEAMHYSLPIITTNVSAMPELVEDGKNGLLVPTANSSALASAISRLVEDSNLRRQMGDDGYQRVRASYYWEQAASQFISVIEA